MYLGIDFGTTFSSAALFVNGEIKRVKEPMRSGYSYPSSAFVNKEGKVFVGQAAENQRGQDPSSYRREFKRDLGQKIPSSLGNRKFLPEDLVSEMLKVLKQEAEEMVNHRIESATVTIPASYAGYRTELMEQAAQDAGFKQVQLLPEPVAAAIYYDRGQPLVDGERLLVYDLGGGTFDAALMQKRGDRFELLAQPVGDEKLGGRDFDTAIYQHLRQNCSETLNQLLDPRQRDARAMRIRYMVEDWLRDFKHQLSVVETHTDDLPIGDFDAYTLSRETFQELIHQQLQTTVDLCDRLVRDAGLKWSQVGRVLLVGGSCRIPYVRQLLEKRFNCNVVRVDDPELAVCLGAAIYQTMSTAEKAIEVFNQAYDEIDINSQLRGYNEAIALNPKLTEAYYNRGILKESQFNDYDGAFADYNDAISVNPKFALAYMNRGILKESKFNDINGALADFNQAISLDPNDDNAYIKRALLKKDKLHDFHGAMLDYNQAISIKPDYSYHYYNRGILKREMNDLDGALTDFNKSICLNPNFASAYMNRGLLKGQKMNDLDGALIDLDKFIILDPNNADAWHFRGVLKYKINDINGAMTDFNNLITLDPNKADAWHFRGILKCQINDINGAMTDFNQAISLDPNRAESYFLIGTLKCEKLNDLGGLWDLKRSVLIEPGNQKYREVYWHFKIIDELDVTPIHLE